MNAPNITPPTKWKPNFLITILGLIVMPFYLISLVLKKIVKALGSSSSKEERSDAECFMVAQLRAEIRARLYAATGEYVSHEELSKLGEYQANAAFEFKLRELEAAKLRIEEEIGRPLTPEDMAALSAGELF